MISVVCSTRKIDQPFEEMIRKSSGLKNEQLEIIFFENNNEYSLTNLYNKGLTASSNDIVVFMHDDIIITSKDWGKKLINHYSNEEYGILGIAGTRSLNESGIWWSEKESMYGIVSHTDGQKTWTNKYSRNFGNEIKEVAVVDGVFFSCHKKRIKKTFNEVYDGFHFYDISFCFENNINDVKVGVIFDIKVTHKSIGEVNEEWNKNRLKFCDENKEYLPKNIDIDIQYTEPSIKLKQEKKLAIIIPTKNKVDELLIPCIDSILEKTKYNNYKIYIADTGSSDDELNKTKEYLKYKENIILVEYDYYNFAKINNDIVKNHIDNDTELILFCNNDIELINDAITIMVSQYEKRSNIGTIGCRLHFENGSIQHLGISLERNMDNQIVIGHKYFKWDYENINATYPEHLTHGNTAAFMMTNKNLFNKLGGFNEAYSECFEDVEYNLKCMLDKKINVTLSKAVCYHFESQTRKREGEQVDLQRLINFINDNNQIIQTFNQIQ